MSFFVSRRLYAVLAALGLIAALAAPAAAETPVSETIHVNLGFSTELEINESVSDGLLGVNYDFSVAGTGELNVNLGADITITYDREDLVPGGEVPVQVTFQPTDDASVELLMDVRADLVANVEVSAATYVGCFLSPLAPICFALIALDTSTRISWTSNSQAYPETLPRLLARTRR